jgi:outer membrane protein TolC
MSIPKQTASPPHPPHGATRRPRALPTLTALAASLAAVCGVPRLPAQATPQPRPTVSLTLPKALDLAMAHNRRLQLASLATADAEQKRLIARSDYFPHIKNESAALHLTALEGIVIPAGAFARDSSTGPIPSQTLRIGQGAADSFTSGTGLIQPITQLLKVHAGVRAATADVNIAKLDASDAQDSISLLVHKLYFDILTRQAQLAAAQQSILAGQVSEQESTQAVAEGRSLEVAQLEAHAALLEQKQASLTDQLTLDDLSMQFDDVLGLPLGTRLALDPDALGETPVLPSPDEAITQLQQANPRILAARQTVEKARAALSAARDAYIPNISGLARYSYQSGVPFLVHNFGTFGGAVSYDLFDGGAREAKLQQAKIELHIAELQLAQTEADLSIQVSAVYDDIQKLQQLIAVASESLVVRKEAARLSQERMRQNAALASEVAKAESNVAAATTSVLDARLNLLLLENQVRQLLGQRPH